MFPVRLIKTKGRFFATRAQELKESVSGTVKEMGKDAKNTAKAAKETLQDDFRAVADSIARASDRVDEKVRGADKERFHGAEEASNRAEQEDQKFVFSEHAENPFNKAAKTMHEAKDFAKANFKNAKESVKESINATNESIMGKSPEQKSIDAAKRAQQSSEGYSEKPTMTDKIESIAEKLGEKIKGGVESVKETITGNKASTPIKEEEGLKYSNINPMGSQPNREPIMKPEGKLNKETEELQKKGAMHKAEEDSFNLM